MADRITRASERAERRRLGVPDTTPRPGRQSLWILASVIATGLAVLAAGERVDSLGQTAADRIEAAELIGLADRSQPDRATSTAPGPSSPSTLLAPLAPPDAAAAGGDTTAGAATGTDDGTVADLGDPAPFSDQERIGRQALAEISYPWRRLLPDWEVAFLPATEGLYGLTMVPERRIEVYVRPDQTHEAVAHVVAHELGHAIDVTFNTGPERRRWAEMRNLGSAPWWPDSGANDFATGAGDFAESFAAWQVGPDGFRSTLGDPPAGEQIELLAELSAG